MIKWFEKLFKQEAPLDYIIADYRPERLNRLRPEYKMDEMEMELESGQSTDEMYVDNLYRH